MTRLPYLLLCTLLGLVLGQIPRFFHGPIPAKYDVLYIKGAVAVWGWYVARSLIGFLVGITSWPPQWWIRGPLCGVLLVGPLCFVSLATPGCGPPCAGWNLTSAVTIGTVVAGVAFLVTGRHHR
jgi:hypothetical protein